MSVANQFKPVYKQLLKELAAINKRSFKAHSEQELKKKQALFQYKKIQYIKEGKSTKDLEKDVHGEILGLPKINTTIVKELVNEHEEVDEKKLNNLQNVTTFLYSQRVYQELVERYNPGLTMDQEDKVKRTANRVGLSAEF